MYSPYQINAATFPIFTEQLCGTQVSASQVSRAIQTLDEELESWRNKYLGEIARLIAKTSVDENIRIYETSQANRRKN